MPELQMAPRRVRVFGREFRWDGEIMLPAGRRLSDFFNNRREDLVELERVTLTRWTQQERPLLSMQRVAVSMNSMILVVLSESQPQPEAQAGEASPMRVAKLAHPVRLVAPPFVLAGGFHAPPGAAWFDAISLTRQRFLGLTAVTVAFLEPLNAPDAYADFILVNRQSVTAIEMET